MTMRELDQFVTLAHTLHFGRASQRCHISPSALSRAIQRVEQEVGTALFERDNRSVQLSPAGEQFLPRAIDLLNGWQQARDAARGQSGSVTGALSLYASVTACYTVLPSLVAHFREHYPDVELSLHTGDAESALLQLREGVADIVVAARPSRMPRELTFIPITETPLVFVAPSRGQNLPASSRSSAWLDQPFVLPASGPARERIDAWFAARKRQPDGYATISGNEAILAMVSLGCGISAVPELVVEHSPLKSRIRRLDLRPALAPYQVGICLTNRTRLRTAPAAFCELVEALGVEAEPVRT